MLLNVLIIYLYFFCASSSCKKVISPGSKDNKLNDCDRCKVITDSFNHWLEKTSRGNYAGGDTAWEEAKLKSYSRSEVRLVEVQEGLCSELGKHQDDCYMFAEQAEQLLEKWWFDDDPNAADLYTWLCIDNLKNCCPLNHYGEFCSPCPLDKENNICSGHGKCDGEGTRKGNGSCVCHWGYAGDYCEECAKNFYVDGDSCKPCHKACDGCSGVGPDTCNACKSGWRLEPSTNTCIDIDECATDSPCKSNDYCINREGSYKCKLCDSSCGTCKGPGTSNCTSCNSSNILWNSMCITDKQKIEFLSNSLRRLSLYLGLLVIAFVISRTSTRLASVIIVIIAMYIYFSEKSSNANLIDVFNNEVDNKLLEKLYTLLNVS